VKTRKTTKITNKSTARRAEKFRAFRVLGGYLRFGILAFTDEKKPDESGFYFCI
jgi:hypothetical protein